MKIVVRSEDELFQVFRTEFRKFQKDNDYLYQLNVLKDTIKEIFLKHIPKTPLFRTRPEWDCSICKQTIYEASKIITISDEFVMIGIFDILLEKYEFSNEIKFFDEMFKDLSNYQKTCDIIDLYYSNQPRFGVGEHLVNIDGKDFIFNHFSFEVDNKFRRRQISKDTFVNKVNSLLVTINKYKDHIDLLEEILEFIEQGYIYRGEEKRKLVKSTIELLRNFRSKNPDIKLFACKYFNMPATLNNDVIATLIEELISGVEPRTAINRYNKKVSPENYRQIKSEIITKGQLNAAKKDLDKIGFGNITEAFSIAEIKDLGIKHVLWTNRIKKESTLDTLLMDYVMTKAPKDPKEITYPIFKEVLKCAKEIEVDISNLQKVALIRADFEKPFFKWGSNIGFCYEGGLADMDFVSQQVKKHGGNIKAAFRISLYWENLDDLDLHIERKRGGQNVRIFYGHKQDVRTTLQLDVDMNVSEPIRGAIENIYSLKLSPKDDGEWLVFVHNYSYRQAPERVIVSIYNENKLIRQYEFTNPPETQKVDVCYINICNGCVKEIKDLIPPCSGSKPKFKKVTDIILSPNFWFGEGPGNKHLFFMVDGTEIKDIRPFNLEQIRPDLVKKHKKVLGILAKKIAVHLPTGRPLIGYGVSFSKKREILIKIDGRPYKLVIDPARDFREQKKRTQPHYALASNQG